MKTIKPRTFLLFLLLQFSIPCFSQVPATDESKKSETSKPTADESDPSKNSETATTSEPDECDHTGQMLFLRSDFKIENQLFHWTVYRDMNNVYYFQIEGTEKKCFYLNILDEDNFKVEFKNKIGEIDSQLDDVAVSEIALKKIFEIQKKLLVDKDTRAKAGYITVKRDLKAYRHSASYYKSLEKEQKSYIQSIEKSLQQYYGYKLALLEYKKDGKTKDYVLTEITNDKFNSWDNSTESEIAFRGLPPITIKKIADDKYKQIKAEILEIGIDETIEKTILEKKKLKANSEALAEEYKNISENTDNRDFGFVNVRIDSIEIKFENGNIENIIAIGQLIKTKESITPIQNILTEPDQQPFIEKITSIKFNNYFPIPFSAIKDYDNDIIIWEYQGEKKRSEDFDYYIYLRDLIEYLPQLANYQDDYSPSDTAFFLKSSEEAKPIYKESTSKLLRSRIFSDFVGLNNDTPNGLIQIEVSKKIIIRNKKASGKNETRRPNGWSGFINFIEPAFVFSKIEQNNKYITPTVSPRECQDCKDNDKIKPEVSLLQLARFQNIGFKTNINLMVGDRPNMKSSFYINVGFGFGVSPVLDTTRIWKNKKITSTATEDKFNIVTLQVTPEIAYQLKSNGKFGFNAALRPNWIFTQSDKIITINNPENSFSDQKSKERFLLTAQIEGSVRTGEDMKGGEIFGRIIYNQLMFYGKQNYYQIQVGYAFNIFRKN